MKMNKILFIYQKSISFVQKDLDILKLNYALKEFQFEGIKDVIRLGGAIKNTDIVFSWFAKLHAFFAVLFSKLFGKYSVVVAGGDDVACVPEIKYGMFSFWWKKWCPLFIFRYADLILPVSKYNEKETVTNAKADLRKVKMIYHGFSSEIFKKNPSIGKENIVITIGSISKETKIKKGLKLFVNSAKFLPDTKFLLIGPDKDRTGAKLKENAPRNVSFLGGVYGRELVDLCSKAKIYVQVSIHESFGCSLAEAMLCECIPVVSRNGAISEVVGNCGIYVDELIPEKIAEKIRYALVLSDDFGVRARERIKTLFSLKKRKERILKAVGELVNG
jgi:glycosyltransferase involved in cell wall biosynthesis